MTFNVTKNEDYGSDEIVAVTYTDDDHDRPDSPESVILFDARYDYGDLGRQVEPIWITSTAAMALEEMGVLLLVGPTEAEVPQPVDVAGSQVYLYAVQP